MEIHTIQTLREIRCDCGSPDCWGEIFFLCPCHPHAGTLTGYDDQNRWLTIECTECGEKIMRILLQSSPAKSSDSNTGDAR
jgi:DNA-directed RNA polymerase subunit RPC12/RpoP